MGRCGAIKKSLIYMIISHSFKFMVFISLPFVFFSTISNEMRILNGGSLDPNVSANKLKDTSDVHWCYSDKIGVTFLDYIKKLELNSVCGRG